MIELHHVVLESILPIGWIAGKFAELLEQLLCCVLGLELVIVMQVRVYQAIAMALHVDINLWYHRH